MISAADSPPPLRIRSTPPDRRLWWAMFATIAVGVALTFALVWQGQKPSSDDSQKPAAPSVPGCGPGQSCTNVLQSAYAVVLGKSLTKWSMGYYAIVIAAMFAAVYAWQL